MRLRLESRRIDTLLPYEANAKRHSPDDVRLIAASIQKWGFRDPIGVLPNGEIVEGHGRFQAAISIGMEEVPVLVLEGLTQDQADLYRIAHNKITLLGNFNFGALATEMRELLGQEITFEQMGFAPDMGENILNMFGEANPYGNVTRVASGGSYDVVWDDKEQKSRFDKWKRAQTKANSQKSLGALLSKLIVDSEILIDTAQGHAHE